MHGRVLLKATNLLFLCTVFGISDVFFLEAEGLFRGALMKGKTMKRKMIIAVLFSALMLCSCEQKNDSRRTESQAETTKKTSLTVASQSVTTTTTKENTTTTRSPDNTVFTSKDGYHTELEGKTEIMEFCKFIAKNWAKVYNGGADFDFTPYCRYGELAKYLDYTAKHGAKTMFSDEPSTNLTELAYSVNNGTVYVRALYSSSTSADGKFDFVVQSVDGKLVLSDMFYDNMDSIDLLVRPEQLSRIDAQYWAKQGRCAELVKKYEKKAAAYTVSDAKTLQDADKEKISRFCIDIADDWANYVSGNMNDSFFRYLKYSDLGTYIKETMIDFAIDGGKYFDVSEADLKIESIKLNGANAAVTGTYPNYLKEQVKLVIIVENVGGQLMINDIICGHKNSPDSRLRAELVANPKSDYWVQVGKLAELEKTM